MKTPGLYLAAAATTALACLAAITPVMCSTQVAAQSNPTLANVILDGGKSATQGRIQALYPGVAALTMVSDPRPPIPMLVLPGVNLTNMSVGDVVSVHYTRFVTYVVSLA